MDVSEIANIENKNTPLTAKFTLTADEYLEGQRIYCRSFTPTMARLFFRFLVPAGIVLLGAGALGFALRWNTGFSLFVAVFGVYLIFGSAVILPRLIKKEHGQCPDHADERIFEFHTEKILVQTAHVKSETAWTYFTRFAETKKAFVLFAPPRVIYPIPKRAFTPGGADQFRSLLREKFPGKRGMASLPE
jgi:hypothetical protein